MALLVAIEIALAACKPAAKATFTGRVSLDYSGTSESDFQFVLTNGSSHAIRFHGSRKLFADTTPLYSAGCYDDRRSVATAIVGPWIWRGETNLVEVSPGDTLRLAILRAEFSQYKGNHCTMTLIPEDGSKIESGAFVP